MWSRRPSVEMTKLCTSLLADWVRAHMGQSLLLAIWYNSHWLERSLPIGTTLYETEPPDLAKPDVGQGLWLPCVSQRALVVHNLMFGIVFRWAGAFSLEVGLLWAETFGWAKELLLGQRTATFKST